MTKSKKKSKEKKLKKRNKKGKSKYFFENILQEHSARSNVSGTFWNILENTCFPVNSWKKSLESGLIEFNYLANFIFRWKIMEIGKILWKNWLHIILHISTFFHKILPNSTIFHLKIKFTK